MANGLLIIAILLGLANLGVVIMRKPPQVNVNELMKLVMGALQEEMRFSRKEAEESARANRSELRQILVSQTESMHKAVKQNVQALGEDIARYIKGVGEQQNTTLTTFQKQLAEMTAMNEQKLTAVRDTVDKRLHLLQEDNAKKLEHMRATVDEKLQTTLEKRLSESFKTVSDRLEQVHKGLGEMQSLAQDVGGLKKVLSNVKTRGILGEVQLENILEQILSPEQYLKNVGTKDNADHVEFAIKLPGTETENPCLLPVDCKFPLECYHALVEAQESGDLPAYNEAAKALEANIKKEAKTIHDKYINPPVTTNFAILFLPIEGLFAEVIRKAGLQEFLQREYGVVVQGPSNITAFLSSLHMGFRTLAITKRSNEVWELLGAVKSQFGTFGELLTKTRKKLQEATNTIDSAISKTATIQRKFKHVESLSADDAKRLLPELMEENAGLEEEETIAEPTALA